MASDPAFRPLTGLYEPSAIQQLPDGRFLVVEDEERHPFSLLTIAPDGSVAAAPLRPGLLESFRSFWKLNDLEGLALDRSGQLYAVTSHSRDGDGNEKTDRNKLVRFRIEGDHVVDTGVVHGLKPALMAAHPVLQQAAAVADGKSGQGFNIEALETIADGQQLLVGFRSPIVGQRAVVAVIENPAAMFDAGEPPRIGATLLTLDLDGGGIRAMAWVASLNGYLVSSGSAIRKQEPFRLWFWSGDAQAPAKRVTVAGLEGFAHAEGVSPAVINGREHIIVVSDDGDRSTNRPAQYLLLDPGQLQIAG